MNTLDLYRQLAAALSAGPVVLATVGYTQGSVPREVGAKMLVTAAGQCFGTIGGGAGEAKVIAQAQAVLATGAKQWVEIDLTGPAAESGRGQEGVCGGQMQVWLERWMGDEAIALVQRLLTHLEGNIAVTLVTPLAMTAAPYIATPTLPLPPAALTRADLTQGDRALIERVSPPPLLLIVGGGHVGAALAQVAHLAGFDIAVQDDRPEWANADRFPQASQIGTGAIAPWLEPLLRHPQLYVALVTRGYRYDCEALQTLLSQPIAYAYIGMIGSAKRVHTVLQDVEKMGISSAALQRIYAPIGIEIGALTPEEIAVSICAELIQVRRCHHPPQ
jgi:xanthine dehydrogenase accessory factor